MTKNCPFKTHLYGNKIASCSIHDRGKHGDGREVINGGVKDDPSPRADHHGHEDGGPAVQEDRAGHRVLVGNVEQAWEEEDVDDEHHHRRHPVLEHLPVQTVGHPGQQPEGGDVAQRGCNGGGDVVGVPVELAGEQHHPHHDEAEDEAGEAGGDDG